MTYREIILTDGRNTMYAVGAQAADWCLKSHVTSINVDTDEITHLNIQNLEEISETLHACAFVEDHPIYGQGIICSFEDFKQMEFLPLNNGESTEKSWIKLGSNIIKCADCFMHVIGDSGLIFILNEGKENVGVLQEYDYKKNKIRNIKTDSFMSKLDAGQVMVPYKYVQSYCDNVTQS